MDIEEIQDFCHSLPGVTEDIKWESNLCFSVAGKMFLLISLDEIPQTASFKVPGEDFEEITCRDGFRTAPYFGRNNWVRLDDIGHPDRKQWESFLRTSYELVKAKLPLRVKRELEGGKHKVSE